MSLTILLNKKKSKHFKINIKILILVILNLKFLYKKYLMY